MSPPPVRSLLDLFGRERATVPEIFAARVARSPESTALIWQGRRWSYVQAQEEIDRFAGFVAATLEPGGRVASYLSNRPEALWSWLGTMFAGAVFVALDRKHKGALLADMLARSKAAILVTQSDALGDLPELAASGIRAIVFVDRAIRVPGASSLLYCETRGHPTPPRPRAEPADLAGVLYTSGTTGRSKAVMISHNQYVRGAARLVDAYGLRPDDVFHNWLPLSHFGGQMHMGVTAIVAGGAIALFPTFSRSHFLDQARETGASVMCGFAAIMHMLWSLPERPDDADTRLRVGIQAGIVPELREGFERRFGVTLGENYGMTECDPITHPHDGVAVPPGSVGRAAHDVEVAILGADGRAAPTGEVGEIAVRPRVPDICMIGYENDSAATIAAWRDLWLHTGDYGAFDADGFLYFKGRAGDYIRRRGENVSVAELAAIMATHPSIAECAAVGVPSPLGEDDVKLVAAPKEGAELDPAEIHDFATRRMARFMVPRYIEIVTRLPRSELGKIESLRLKSAGLDIWDAEKRKT
ncbi:MAG: AMP-binding protein [Alphaproteobacteria bacterium]